MNDVFSIECTNMPCRLDENQIFFVEREYEWYINQYIGRNSKRFAKAFDNFKYSFGYLPESKDLNLFLIVQQILRATHDVNHALCKFAYMDGDRAVFYCAELDNDEKEESLAKQFYHFACWCTVDVERRKKWHEWEEEEAKIRESETEGCWVLNSQPRPHVQIVNDIDGLEQLEEFFDDIEDTKPVQSISNADMILQDIKTKLNELRSQGISEERIQKAIAQEVELSRVEVTSDYHILLPDYHKELLLPPVQKALYLLFLHHPDGIRIKGLSDFKEELNAFYLAVSGRSNHCCIAETVERLCNPFDNSIHEKLSNLRNSITRQLGDTVAENYCLSGDRGMEHLVPIPPDMIIWQ